MICPEKHAFGNNIYHFIRTFILRMHSG